MGNTVSSSSQLQLSTTSLASWFSGEVMGVSRSQSRSNTMSWGRGRHMCNGRPWNSSWETYKTHKEQDKKTNLITQRIILVYDKIFENKPRDEEVEKWDRPAKYIHSDQIKQDSGHIIEEISTGWQCLECAEICTKAHGIRN